VTFIPVDECLYRIGFQTTKIFRLVTDEPYFVFENVEVWLAYVAVIVSCRDRERAGAHRLKQLRARRTPGTPARSASVMRRSAALGLVAGGVLAGAQSALAQAVLPTVRIGTMAIDAGGQAYYGTDAGIFVANGVNPQVTTMAGGAPIVAAILSGDLEVGASNPLQVAAAIARGIPLQMVAPGCLYSKRDASANLFVAKASPMTKPTDLAGATFGVGALGDFNQLSLLAWLDGNGVARDGVKFVELKFGELGLALQRGTVQAAIIAEPAKTEALRAGLVREFGDTYLAIEPELCPLAWVAAKGWLEKNPDTMKSFVKGLYATAKWANVNTRQSAGILAKYSKVDRAVVASTKRLYFATANDRKYVEPILNLAARYHMLARPVTFEEFSA
jgi:NitT/TauT family transport system substrate-binding protein